MGSLQSYITPNSALTAVVVAGAIALGYSQVSRETPARTSSSSLAAKAGASKKGKKKKQAGNGTQADADREDITSIPEVVVPTVVSLPAIIPGQFEPSTPHDALDAATSVSLKPKKAKKKKAKATSETTPATSAAGSTVVAAASAPVHSDSSSGDRDRTPPSLPPTKSKSKRQQKQQPSASSSSALLTKPAHKSTTSIDTDGSWTRVEPSRRKTGPDSGSAGDAGESQSGIPADSTNSDTGVTTSVTTGNSSPVAERTEDEGFLYADRGAQQPRKTLAERMLPKPRKTGVDDMLETPDYPVISRVMRVQPLADEKPVSGYSWADYEDVRANDGTAGAENDADGEDDGWGVVKSRGRSKMERSSSSSTQQPQTQKASETLTKRQRQNANKRDAEKAAKADAERQRLETLARHKRDLERVKIAEQFAKGGSKKTPSGGMNASLDAQGKMVWD